MAGDATGLAPRASIGRQRVRPSDTVRQASAGTVDPFEPYFESLLLPNGVGWDPGCLTPRGRHAPLPTGKFDFSLHRSRVYLASYANSTYPYTAPPAGTEP